MPKQLIDSYTTYTHCCLCNRRQKLHIKVFEDCQYWECEEGRHVLVYDARGKVYQGAETRSYDDRNWRSADDRKRELDYNPNGQAWRDAYGETRQRRTAGGNFNFYPTADGGTEDNRKGTLSKLFGRKKKK